MAIVIFVVVLVVILGLLAGVHWYLWRRLVRDTTVPGGKGRRIGTAAAVILPLTTFGAFLSGRSGAPFVVERIFAWPGYLWLAAVLYLTLALLVGEAVRPLLRRFLERRAVPAAGAAPATAATEAAPRVAEAPVAAAAGTAAVAAGATAVTPRTTEGTPESAPSCAPSGAGTPDDRAPAATAPSPAPESRPAGDRAAGPADPGRRLFIARTVAGAAAVAGLGTVGYGAYGVLDGPTTKRVTVPLAKLPRSAHGFRIAVVSDIHLGPVLGRSHTRRIVDAINRTQPDLVAIVGDLVDGSVADLGPAAEPLADLRSRHGSFFVTGNHEYFSGAGQWVDFVRELGVHPLENARVELPGFDLAGVNDISAEGEGPAGQGPDYDRALGDRDRSRASVLMAHQPVMVHAAADHGVDLQLSGHTHGGQVWPGPYLAELANPTVAGLERYGDTQLYVTRGAGAWGPPVRVGAESDITVVTLASKQA